MVAMLPVDLDWRPKPVPSFQHVAYSDKLVCNYLMTVAECTVGYPRHCQAYSQAVTHSIHVIINNCYANLMLCSPRCSMFVCKTRVSSCGDGW